MSKTRVRDIHHLLHVAEADLDGCLCNIYRLPEKHKKFKREWPKIYRRILRALGYIRRAQGLFPQKDYSLFRWIINHTDEYDLRFRWTCVDVRMSQAAKQNKKLTEFFLEEAKRV